MKYCEKAPESIRENLFTMYDRDWAILSAGTEQSFNSMTVSWGGAGTLWGKPAATVYVRPQRYTLEFLRREPLFTLGFFTPEQHGVLAPFGFKSGRDCDKYALSGIQPVFAHDTVFPDGARLVLICRKQYQQQMDPACFLDPSLDKTWYGAKDYHWMLIGEVQKVLVREE